MRAAVMRAVGDPMVVRDDLELRAVGPGEVRVRLRASGVCHSDLSILNGTLGARTLPAVLGHEGAGEIAEVGPGVSGLAPGDHVILSWVPPCGRCALCLGGQPHLCTSGRPSGPPTIRDAAGADVHLGIGGGTFAEETIVPAIAAIPIPSDVPYEIAALVGCGVMTGVGAALNTAAVRPGSSVVVIGCGGVGVNVVQGARAAGAATILAVDRVPGKRATAGTFGATDACADTELGDAVERLTGGAGFDYAFEVVGRSETIRQAWDATRRGGTTVVVGAGSARDTVTFTAAELFATGRTLLGCLYGSADVRTDFARVLRMWRAGRLDLEPLVSATIALDDVNDACAAMENGDVVRSVIRY
jgi:S-(hydroxymethyl)glutathione dehydrogenase/alcohol dehydrogenase